MTLNREMKNKFVLFFTVPIILILLVSCYQKKSVSDSTTICRDGFHLTGNLTDKLQVSNNQQWILANCESITQDHKYVRVFRVDRSTSWDVSLDNFPWIAKNDPLSGLVSYLWMKDGNHVYLRPAYCCFDSSNHGVFVTNYSLYLLNLQTGELSIVLSGENNDVSPFSTSISPDEKYLVYVDLANAPNILNISNLQTGEKKFVKLNDGYIDTGDYVWTPDNSKLIFVAVFDGWKSSSLYSLEMKNFTLNTLVDNDERLLFPTSKWDYQGKWGSWKDEDTLFLSEFIGATDWAVNIQTGILVEDHSPDSPP